jgi:hypothetical protein
MILNQVKYQIMLLVKRKCHHRYSLINKIVEMIIVNKQVLKEVV